MASHPNPFQTRDPKRRAWIERKNYYRTQEPGLTAKGDQRLFVKHPYTDHSNDQGDTDYTKKYKLVCYADGKEAKTLSPNNGLRLSPPSFPLKLHLILECVENGDSRLKNAICWLPHGRAFHVRNHDLFAREVLPKYFKNCKMSSFFRQINLYGFVRLTAGLDTGAYYHEKFLRGKAFLTKHIIRTKVKGTKYRAASAPQDEPNFYSMRSLGSTSGVKLDSTKPWPALASNQEAGVIQEEPNFQSMTNTSTSTTSVLASTPPESWLSQTSSNLCAPPEKDYSRVPNERCKVSTSIPLESKSINYSNIPFVSPVPDTVQRMQAANLVYNDLASMLPTPSPLMQIEGGMQNTNLLPNSYGQGPFPQEYLLPFRGNISELTQIASMPNVSLSSHTNKQQLIAAILQASGSSYLYNLRNT